MERRVGETHRVQLAYALRLGNEGAKPIKRGTCSMSDVRLRRVFRYVYRRTDTKAAATEFLTKCSSA